MSSSTLSPAHEAAQIAKLAAETAKLQAETGELQLQQLVSRANIREAIANAEQAEYDAQIRKITADEKQRMEDLTKVHDLYAHHHFFDGPVNEKSVYSCLNTINAWHRQDPESAWNITINSGGGSAIDGMHLFDTIKAYSLGGNGTHEITITVRGYAASMAGILLQAADNRVIGPEAWLMIHEISAGAGGKIGEIQDSFEWYKKMCARVANIFVQRSNGMIDLETFKAKWERSDWWLSSDEALELGFVDRIG